MPRRPPKLEALLTTVGEQSPVLIVTHDNPDPDSLASAAALQHLLTARTAATVDIAYGGKIGRVENRALVEVLGLRVRPLEECDVGAYPVLAIVDFQHTSGNHSLPSGRIPDIAFDHHPVQRGSNAVRFTDYRSRIGATCTIVAQYLFAGEVPIDKRIATALTYGIKSETLDFKRATHGADIETYMRLYPLADKRQLAQIEMAPVEREHFGVLARALGRARLFGNVLIVTVLGRVPNGDVAAEMADVFLRLGGLRCAAVLAQFDGKLIVSVRTLSHRDHAGEIIQRVFAGRGSAGGHAGMAAGRVPLQGCAARAVHELERDIVRAFRREFAVTAGPGRRLVPAS